MSIAWVFPGQGSQKLGMAEEIISLPGARDRFELASSLLGRDLFRICQGTESTNDGLNDLNDTRNTQPAMFVIESLLVDHFLKQSKHPSVLAGHSLGEIVALYAAGVFDAETALKLLKSRSELMASADKGGMTAIIGFDKDQLNELLSASEGVVIANDNSDSQIVLSGDPEALSCLLESLNCKKAIPLKVSGAFHSPFMSKPAKAFEKILDEVTFCEAEIPVVSNSEPDFSCDCNVLKQRLKKQMITGVRWRETMKIFIKNDIKTLIEIGPGNVLGGLAKRSMKGVIIKSVSSPSYLFDS